MILGVLGMFDPPFPSSKPTIQLVEGEGIKIKMVTGDDTDIAIETAKQLGLGTNILSAPDVFPQHKYAIVKVLQQRGHLVGMTGDGVNDAPALKQANCGIAVSDAVAAARAAAALILTAPGLQVINTGIQAARKIFQRITAYTTYRVALTINIMFLVVLGTILCGFTPLSALMIVVISLLDDVPIMTIAYDNAYVSKKPVRWHMGKIIGTASALGFFAVVQSMLVLWWAHYQMSVGGFGITDKGVVESVVFLQLVTGGHMLVLVARARNWFFLRPFPAWQLWTTLLAMATIGVLMVGFGLFVPKVAWNVIGMILLYNLGWMFIQNIVKLITQRIFDHESKREQQHTERYNRNLSVAREDWDKVFDHHKEKKEEAAPTAA